jgi:hypothetical protein
MNWYRASLPHHNPNGETTVSMGTEIASTAMSNVQAIQRKQHRKRNIQCILLLVGAFVVWFAWLSPTLNGINISHGVQPQQPSVSLCEQTAGPASEEILAQFLIHGGGPTLAAKVGPEVARTLFTVSDIATDGRLGSVTYCTATFRPIGVVPGKGLPPNPTPAQKRFSDAAIQAIAGLDPMAQNLFAAVMIQMSALPAMRGQYSVRPLDSGRLHVEFAPGALMPAR